MPKLLIEIFLYGILETKETPFVSSIIPVKTDFIKEKSIPKILKSGKKTYDKREKKPLIFNIEIKQENITTKPPIIIIVLLEFNILLPSTSPKLEKLQYLFEFFM